MQRKTNLFYTQNQDSNFLTFSNFTEALTGNFLSTDWKVYPSRFLCLYIPTLVDEQSKQDFIKNYLVAYYENKLAFLRDYYTKQLNNSNNVKEFDIEGDINALAWLFETINKYCKDNSTEYEINFIGEVTEFDYKGTYTDSICIIDASEGYKEGTNQLKTYNINVDSKVNILYSDDNENVLDKSILYNWTTSELANTDYENLNVKLDNNDDNTYSIYSEYELTTDVTDRTNLRFNVIIPLFDITNIYATSNFNSVEESFSKEENLEYKNYVYNESTNTLEKVNIDYSSKELRSINNPMGIWFSDEVIELKRDKESKYAPSWSITISSQFKPFPYSGQYLNNDITSTDNQQAFQTYAQILARQSTLNYELSNISSRLTKLEQTVSRLNNLSTQSINEKLLEYDTVIKELKNWINIYNNLDTIVEEKVNSVLTDKLKWKN